ncbi:MAG: ricin-type beta-trefoil lectin domain protein [Saccharothrix sp.]|nr:ricin-type beta-trefoil lectin domain protein [Saccharothrix sp.]
MRFRTSLAAALLALSASVTAVTPPATAAPDHAQRSSLADSPRAAIHIRNAASNLCLAVRQGSGERPVIQTTCDYSVGTYWPDQYWDLVAVDAANSIYRLRNTQSGLCVAARGSGETNAIATTCGAGTQWTDQQWRLQYVAKWGADRVQNRASGNCLAARGTGESNAIATTCNYDWPDQHWW